MTLSENYFTKRAAVITLDPRSLPLRSSPDRPLRGVQIGYRPKTNSYDGLTPALFESYVRDLAIFGANQIELIPHSFDDAPYSPHFFLDPQDMIREMARACDKYGLNVSLWFPACDPAHPHSAAGCLPGDYTNPAVMAAAKQDWHNVFSSLPRIDTLFLNAGDPGGHEPKELVVIARTAKSVLNAYFPNASLWICPQDWDEEQYQAWLEILAAQGATGVRSWLDGIVYGPGMVVPLGEFAKSMAPYSLPIRLYPDMTHSLSDQLPIPNWDPAFQWTEGRETVNPRPLSEGRIAARQKVHADAGMSSYNEGCHDDVNKHVWLAVFWGADDGDEQTAAAVVVRSWLKDYARLHVSPRLASTVLDLIYGLESNWQGPVEHNPSINQTYALAEGLLTDGGSLVPRMTPRDRLEWRLQQLMYRAHYDKFVQQRVATERLGVRRALASIRQSLDDGHHSSSVAAAVAKATLTLDEAAQKSRETTSVLWTEMRVWAEALFQSVHQQFSVNLYGAEYTRRGANLDMAHLPVTNAPFLRRELRNISALPPSASPEAWQRLQRLVDRTVSGSAYTALAGATSEATVHFYDSLGELDRMPHFVPTGEPGNEGDQSFGPSITVVVEKNTDQYYQPNPTGSTSKNEPTSLPDDLPLSQMTSVTATRCLPRDHGLPIRLTYPDLPPRTRFNATVVFANGAKHTVLYNVTANGHYRIWTDVAAPPAPARHTFAIPASITAGGGNLTLDFSNDVKGATVAEVWLIKV
jgi:hypothetical protein